MATTSNEQTNFSQQALNRAVREAVEYVHAAGWDQSPSIFALVPATALADVLGDRADGAPLAVVEQEPLPEGIDGGSPELADFIARTSWPAGVVGAVLAQEIMVISPDAAASLEGATLAEVRAHADGESARQARLFSGVIADGPHLTLIQPRPTEEELASRGPFAEDDIVLKDGSGIADGVLSALYSTFSAD